jgi:hypothetical protein
MIYLVLHFHKLVIHKKDSYDKEQLIESTRNDSNRDRPNINSTTVVVQCYLLLLDQAYRCESQYKLAIYIYINMKIQQITIFHKIHIRMLLLLQRILTKPKKIECFYLSLCCKHKLYMRLEFSIIFLHFFLYHLF